MTRGESLLPQVVRDSVLQAGRSTEAVNANLFTMVNDGSHPRIISLIIRYS